MYGEELIEKSERGDGSGVPLTPGTMLCMRL